MKTEKKVLKIVYDLAIDKNIIWSIDKYKRYYCNVKNYTITIDPNGETRDQVIIFDGIKEELVLVNKDKSPIELYLKYRDDVFVNILEKFIFDMENLKCNKQS